MSPAPSAATGEHDVGMLPGTAVIRSIRLLVVWAIVAVALYSLFAHSSRGGCFGGIDGRGGWIDTNGEPTANEPQCYMLQLGPSPLVLIALAGTVVWALTRVLRRAQSEPDALRILSRAGLVLVAIALGSLAIAQIWFFLLPVEQFADGTGTLIYPFPFASVEFELEPLTQR